MTSLSALLRDMLSQIRVAPDELTATVAGRAIEAKDPREMRRLLAEALYDVLHTGQAEKRALTMRIRDDEFEGTLARVVTHRETMASVILRASTRHDNDESPVLVEREGVRVWVPRRMIRTNDEMLPGTPVTLLASALRPALSPGFLVVDGVLSHLVGRDILRVYVHITEWHNAPAVLARALECLTEQRAGYRAKILSAKPLYPRRDAMVIYLGADSWQVVEILAEALRDMPGIGQGTSVFAERIGTGMAIAWEPSDRRTEMRGLSFGQHRATVLALALLEGAGTDAPLDEVIEKRFAEADIDVSNPGRNRESPALVLGRALGA